MKKTEEMKETNDAAGSIVASAATWLARARFLCEKHPVISLVAVLCAPELFVIAMGMACTAVPQLLGASAAILAVCVLLWIAGLGWWTYVQVGRRRGKHAHASQAKAQERGLR